MTAPLPLFDHAEAQARKREGLERVEARHGRWIDRARQVASWHAERYGTVTADELRWWMADDQPDHPNAWGAVFRSGFEWTGESRQSALVQGHGNWQRVWRVKT